ncbi:protein arginine methyltransferase NDUFAF7 homolog, mitochondrial-like [Uranotaenia lowii]|uniref:protein arginine methyltransferase NDUFAF7 homolog, mitochondrial-like n=1 Tax=Uranotaenia lowii TaxID=190385 RepID=UPI002479D5F9|nr:protein arginine methyltransferase NDUFAF7 homolog, mitochondrial-like [Uranotaenia lowii]
MILRKVSPFLPAAVRRYSYKPVRRVSLPPASKLNTPGADENKAANGGRSPVSLKDELQSRIRATGPIPVATYMKQVLTNPASGYYMTPDEVLGSKGDFVTSPEIGQIFGEMIAVWFLTEWSKFGRPSPYQLVELGPGKGTMMKDILRVCDGLNVTPGLSIHLVEMSEHLSKVQASTLCISSSEFSDKPFYRSGYTASGTKVFWYRQLEDVPETFSIILAHEFFDALPIHKFQQHESSWKEVLIDIDPADEGKFRFINSNAETPMLRMFLNNYQHLVRDRSSIEISFDSELIIRQIGKRFNSVGGFALIVDYGHLGEKGDTFRAFKAHKLHDPLMDPGAADLTADVDFSILKQFCERTGQIFTVGPTSQRAFLEMAGAQERLKVLVEAAEGEDQKRLLENGFHMLTDPEQMGERFKFFGLFPKELESFLKSSR